MLGDVVIPEPVRTAALFPEEALPEPPPEHPYRQVRRDGYTIGLFPGQTFGTVSVRSIDADAVGQTVQEVRRLLTEDGKSRGAWMVPDAASPAGLAKRLPEYGLAPFDEPPLEPRFAAMVLTAPPESDGGVEARPPQTFEEFQATLASVPTFSASAPKIVPLSRRRSSGCGSSSNKALLSACSSPSSTTKWSAGRRSSRARTPGFSPAGTPVLTCAAAAFTERSFAPGGIRSSRQERRR
jgi:hypothetical protein